ncbi:MAG: hypothetical protein M1821_002197 [Bathelium mastoideum]|nr:MAG: hypothetical protein M1821_002197 [Bathelium mastoideum]
MATEDLISFDIIEDHKENIQSLPSGRSAKALASTLSPLTAQPTPPLSATQTLNDSVRAGFEKEIQNLDESDDPLDIFDRYVKWTFDAYPSAQATPQSQLLPLLERATKAFLSSEHYQNDPRYLKLWLHYIRLFSDAPRETFAFLARHNIGELLALYYEEFAAWLESAGRWAQAEEVYCLGLDRQARPHERLARKFAEFQQRREEKGQITDGPNSPALPISRPALAEKVDPFTSHTGEEATIDPQARDRREAIGAAKKSTRQKLAVFSDTDEPERMSSRDGPRGWESIQSLGERKKENSVEARPWIGETMKGGKRNVGVPKMTVFKDQPSFLQTNRHNLPNPLPEAQCMPNPKTGKMDFVFAKLDAVYPNPADPSEEYCFEELRAKHRGWLDYSWTREQQQITNGEAQDEAQGSPDPQATSLRDRGELEEPIESLERKFQKTLALNDVDENGVAVGTNRDMERRLRREEKANRTRKIKVMEVKAETQTIQTNLVSPTGPKLKRKKSGERAAEPTMTINTREAMDEVYGIFNAALSSQQEEEGSEGSDDEDDYTSTGESTGTGRISGATSECGDETRHEFGEETRKEVLESQSRHQHNDTISDAKSEAEWSEFTTSKHVPSREDIDGEADHTATSKAVDFEVYQDDEPKGLVREQADVITPIDNVNNINSENIPPDMSFVPRPPEDFEAPTHPFRNPDQVAQSKLPFMTPIVEKTESSLGLATAKTDKDYFNSKTPSRQATIKTPSIPELGDDETLSSPFQEISNESLPPRKKLEPIMTGSRPQKPKPTASPVKTLVNARAASIAKEDRPKGPIIKELQCNPVDEDVRKTILEQTQPPLCTLEGYYDYRTEDSNRLPEIVKFVKAIVKARKSNSADKAANTNPLPPVLRFPDTERVYTVKRELGKGAFAPVYLVENPVAETDDHESTNDSGGAPSKMGEGAFAAIHRHPLEAIKCEDPPTAWEFYILRTAHRRLGVHRAATSLIHAHELHLYRTEGFLVEEYRDQGTLLDLVNLARADAVKTGGGSSAAGSLGVEEPLAMFLTVELLRTVEALHRQGVIHGDLKPDNVLLRLDDAAQAFSAPLSSSSSSSTRHADSWDTQYHASGAGGWSSKGISLIDFGRGIDVRAFAPETQFVADWPTTETDCAEMRELRPWTFQVDYHGLAGCLYTLLFGRYLETVAEKGSAGGGVGVGRKRYRIREGLKRYWQVDIWSECFELLLNSATRVEGEDGMRLPVLRGLKEVRERMEAWLTDNCEKGLGLKGMVRRMEGLIRESRRK